MICDCINMHHYGILIHIQLSGGKNMNGVLEKIDNLVWGMPLIVMILAIGFFLTIRLHGLQPHRIRRGHVAQLRRFAQTEGRLSARVPRQNRVRARPLD